MITERHNRLNVLFSPLIVLDYSKGFGGKYGVQKDRQDPSALGWDHVEKVEKHGSQRGKLCTTAGGSGGACGD